MKDNNEDPKNLPQQQQINIELGEKEAEGIYSNLAILTHSPAEFIIDFTRVFPGIPKAKVHARIIMTPQHAKMYLAALQNSVAGYEQQYGEIQIHQNTPNSFGLPLPVKPKDEKIN